MASIRITIDVDLREDSRLLASKVSQATAVVCAELVLHGTKYVGTEPLRDINGNPIGKVEVIECPRRAPTERESEMTATPNVVAGDPATKSEQTAAEAFYEIDTTAAKARRAYSRGAGAGMLLEYLVSIQTTAQTAMRVAQDDAHKLEAFDGLLDVCEYIEANLQPSVFDDEGDCRTWLVKFGVLARAGLQVAIAKATATKQPPAAEAAEGLETRLAES